MDSNQNNSYIYSQDQKEQLKIIEEISIKITEEYEGMSLDLGRFDRVRSSKGDYFSIDGKILHPCENKKIRGKDSKTLDALTYFKGKDGRRLDIYYFCKYTRMNGGSQNEIDFEVARTIDNIKKNTNEYAIVLFMLEGSYWEDKVVKGFDFDNKKIFYVNRDTLEKTLINIFLTNHLI